MNKTENLPSSYAKMVYDNNGMTGRFELFEDILCRTDIVELLEYVDCLKTVYIAE